MKGRKLADHLDYLVSRQGQDEAAVLAQALRTGIEALYEETLIEEYLLGRVPRETLLQELGSERLNDVEDRKDALRREVEWGLKGA